MRRFVIIAIALLWTGCASAQQVLQSGLVTVGHGSKWLTNGVIGDAGGAAGGPPGTGLTELGITNTGLPFCINDAPITSTGGYHQFCLGSYTSILGTAGAFLTYNAYGGARALGLTVNLNGVNYPFPGSGLGNVIGPTSPTPNAGDAVEWNGGTTVKDGGAPPVLVVLTNAALQASCTQASGCPAGDPVFPNGVWRQSFYAAGVVESSPAPPLFYVPESGTCTANGLTADNGYCVNTADGNSVLGMIGTEADPRQWGAVHNGQRYNASVVISSSSATITASGGCASSANVGQNIVIYDFADPPYQGTISSGTTGSQIVLSSVPSFSYTGNATIICGSDDSTALNAAIAYASLFSKKHRPVNLAGLNYGTIFPVTMQANVDLQNGLIIALNGTHFIPDPYNTGVNGIIDFTNGNNNVFHLWVDAADLPINCFDVEDAAQVRIGPTVNCQHWGQNYSSQAVTGFTMNIVDSGGHPNYEATVASTSGLTNGMFYHQALSGGPTALPDNAGIVQVVDGTHLILSAPPTANISNASLSFYKDGNCMMVGAQHSGAIIADDLNCQQFVVNDPNSGSTNPAIRAGAALYWGNDAGASAINNSILQFGSTSAFQDGGGINLQITNSFFDNGGNSSMINSPCYENAAITMNTTLSFLGDTFTDCVFNYFALNGNFIAIDLSDIKFQSGSSQHLPYNQIYNFVTNQASEALASNRYSIQAPYSFASSFLPIAISQFGGGSWSAAAKMLAGGVNNSQPANSDTGMGRSSAPFTFSATTDGSTGVLTGVGSFSGGNTWANVYDGLQVSGTGITANAYVIDYNQTAETITLNFNTTASGTITATATPLNTAPMYGDSGCVYNYANGSTAATVPIPIDLPPGWKCRLYVQGSGTVTLEPLSGGTINGSMSSDPLSQNTLYQMSVNNTGNLSVK